MKHIKMVNNYTNTKEMKMKNKVLNIAKEVFTTTGMVLGAISIITLLNADSKPVLHESWEDLNDRIFAKNTFNQVFEVVK